MPHEARWDPDAPVSLSVLALCIGAVIFRVIKPVRYKTVFKEKQA